MFVDEQQVARRKRNLKILVVVIICAVIAGVSARPVWRAMKRLKAGKLATQAEAQFEAKSYAAAVETTRAALALDHGNVRALSSLARALTRLGSEDALVVWKHLWSIRPPLPNERAEAIELALSLRALTDVEEMLDRAIKEPPVSPATWRQAAVYFEFRADPLQAAEAARRYLKDISKDDDMRLFLARQLLATPQFGTVGEAKTILWPLARATNATQIAAMGLLAAQPNLSRAELEDLLVCVRSWPGTNITARELGAFDLRLRLEPERRTNLLEEAVAQFANGPVVDRLALSLWLLGKQEPARVEGVIPAALAATNREMFVVRADALSLGGKWAELDAALARPGVPLEPMRVSLYRARAAKELQHTNEAVMHWEQAQSLAVSNGPALGFLAEHAERVGELDQAERAARQLARFPRARRPAYAMLLRIADARGDARAQRKLMQEIVSMYPDEIAPQNDLAYLDALVGENLPEAKRTAERLIAKYPARFAHRITYSLAALRQHDVRDAWENLRKGQVNWQEMPPNCRAVFAAVLGAYGETNQAREITRTLTRAPLKAEERELVKAWLDVPAAQ